MARVLLLVALVSFLCVGCLEAWWEPTTDIQPALDFSLQDINDNTVTLSSYKNNKAVILFFWNTGCQLCGTEMSTLSDLYPFLSKDGIEILAVDIGESKQRVNACLRSLISSFKVLLDNNVSVASEYHIGGVPTYILINKKGNIVFRGHFFPASKYKELLLK